MHIGCTYFFPDNSNLVIKRDACVLLRKLFQCQGCVDTDCYSEKKGQFSLLLKYDGTWSLLKIAS